MESMKAWIGKSIVAIGVIHCMFGSIVFRKTLAELSREGFWNTVNGQPQREFAFWFIFFGVMAILLGLLMDWCERKFHELPVFLGWGLLALTVVCCTLMPISGGWLLLIPSLGAIVRRKKAAVVKL